MDIEIIYKTVPFSELNIGDVFEIPRKASDNSLHTMYMVVDEEYTIGGKNVIDLREGKFWHCNLDNLVRKLNGKFVAYD